MSVRLPERSQNVFGRMEHTRHGVKIDDAGGSFKGMESPKGAIQPVLVIGVFLQCHQVVYRLGDKFTRFEEKLFDELVHRGAPQKMAAYSARISGLTGLTR